MQVLTPSEYDERELRDRHLGLHWRIPNRDLILALGVPFRNEKQFRAINSILTEVVLAAEEGRRVSYSRHRPSYTGKQRFHGISYTLRTITRSVDELVELGLVESWVSSKHNRGTQSKVWATPMLMDALKNEPAVQELRHIIRLKDDEGVLIDYPVRDATHRLKKGLERINRDLGSIQVDFDGSGISRTSRQITIDGSHYRITPPALYRVFNRGSLAFDMGGRAYSGYQSIPQACRQKMLLNGESVAEPDFEAMHVSIAYAQRDKPLTFDPYTTGEFPRAHGKLALMVDFNAASREGAIMALLNKKDDTKNPWPYSWSQTSKLIGCLERLHPTIRDFFHSDRGIRWMRKDSDIILRATRMCLDAGIAALPVHDSIVCPSRDRGRVGEIMQASFAHSFPQISACSIRGSAFEKPTDAEAFSPSA